MRYKFLFLSVLGALIIATIVLQMTSMGNDEEMVETEYDEFQIRIDFNRMGQGFLSLFTGKTPLRTVETETESAENMPPDGMEEPAETVPILWEAPRAPTLNTLPPMTNRR